MPVQTLSGSTPNNLYCHVYNRGIDDNIIFKEDTDCKIFLGFLQEYLSAPNSSESSKKVFNIRGHAFRGTPHQPKNYFDKIELVAYSLSPDHFHLVLDLKHKDNLQGFIRSLSTRYSIYFNKKYKRSGSLFAGPYKSIFIKDDISVLLLTRFLHTHGLSSYPEYLGTRVTPWIKPELILPYLDKIKGNTLEQATDYKYFVERYKLSQTETDSLKKISLENNTRDFRHVDTERNEPTKNNNNHTTTITINPKHRIPEYIAINTVFFFLLTLGIGNITLPKSVQYNLFTIPVAKNIIARVSPTIPTNVLGIKTKTTTTTNNTNNINMVSVSIRDGKESIDIYKEDNTESEKIGSAKSGAVFEIVTVKADWYQIKLPNGTNGFILSRYANVGGGIVK